MRCWLLAVPIFLLTISPASADSEGQGKKADIVPDEEIQVLGDKLRPQSPIPIRGSILFLALTKFNYHAVPNVRPTAFEVGLADLFYRLNIEVGWVDSVNYREFMSNGGF